MSKFKSFVKKRRVLIIVLVIIIIIIAVVANFINSASQMAQMLVQQPSISGLSRQSLENVIVASGTTASSDSRSAVVSGSTATANAKITAINVEVGDVVTEGQILATLDDEAAMDNIENANEKYSDTVTDITESGRLTDHNLAIAQDAYNDAVNSYNEQKAAYNAQADPLKASIAALNAEITNITTATGEQVAQALTAWGQTVDPTIPLDGLQAAVTALYNTFDDAAKADLTNALTVNTYNTVTSLQQQLATKTADNQKLIAEQQATLDKITAEFSATETQLLKSVETAQNSLTQQTIQSETSDIQNARNLEDLNEAIVDAQESIEDTYIRSPMSGVVTALNFREGEVLSGALGTIQNLTAMEINLSIPSYDAVVLQVGMAAEITTDSTGDNVLQGVIESISPIAMDQQGNFSVTVSITSTDENLRAGVPAEISFMIDKVDDVYAVPLDAVVEEDGSYYVYVYDTMPTAEQSALGEQDGRRKIKVSTGMETDYMVQITSTELADGMLILEDPLGLNVQSNMFDSMMGGNVVVATETGPAGGPPAGGSGGGRG